MTSPMRTACEKCAIGRISASVRSTSFAIRPAPSEGGGRAFEERRVVIVGGASLPERSRRLAPARPQLDHLLERNGVDAAIGGESGFRVEEHAMRRRRRLGRGLRLMRLKNLE